MTPFPPKTRSRAADGMDAAARRGRFELQVCDRCESVQYPCRDACRACLSESLTWRSVPAEGELLARTLIRSSAEPFFQTRLPIAIGLVQMARGAQVVSFLDAGIDAGDRVSLRLEIDPAGRALVHATRIDPA